MNEFEREVTAKLLRGEHPDLEILRSQLDSAEVRAREASDFGFLTDLWVPESSAVLDMRERFAIDDVFGRTEGAEEEICFLLHVVRGRAKTLEGFVASGRWPASPRLVELWYVQPDPEQAGQLARAPERNLGFALRGTQPRVDGDGD